MREEEYPFYGVVPCPGRPDVSSQARQEQRWQQRLHKREVLECVLAQDQEWDPAGDHIAADLYLLSIHERLWYAEYAGLTEKQRLVYTDWAIGLNVTEIARGVLGGVSYQAAKKTLDYALEKVGKVMAADRFHGWMLVYLEDITRRKLF